MSCIPVACYESWEWWQHVRSSDWWAILTTCYAKLLDLGFLCSQWGEKKSSWCPGWARREVSPAYLMHCDCCSQKVRVWITPCLLTWDAIVAGVSKLGSYIGQPEHGTETDGLWRPLCCFRVLGSVCHMPLATDEGWSFSLQCYHCHVHFTSGRENSDDDLGQFMLLGTPG